MLTQENFEIIYLFIFVFFFPFEQVPAVICHVIIANMHGRCSLKPVCETSHGNEQTQM